MYNPFSTASIRWARLSIGVVLTVGIAFAATPPVDVSGATPALKVTVYCYSSRERTVIKNQTSRTIRIRTVGSIYQPYSTEPFLVVKSLAAGATITYYTGAGATWASSRTLTRRSIYNNAVGTREGARVKTMAGTSYTDRC
jgi:hypothetical protein